MILLVTIFFVNLVLFFFYLFLSSNKNYWEKLGIPHIKPNFLFGNSLPLMKQDVCRGIFFGKLHASTKNPYYGFFMLRTPFLLIRDITIVKSILIKDFDHFHDRIGGECESDNIGGNILFFTQSEIWKQLRSAFSPIFSSGKLRNMFTISLKIGDDLIKYIEKESSQKEEVECMDAILMFITDIIATCFFGFKAESLKNGDKKFYKMSKLLAKPTFSRVVQITCFLLLPKLTKLFKMKLFDQTSEAYIQNIFLKVVEERRRTKHIRGDLVDLLIKVQKNNSNVLSNDKILAQPLQFHFAGFDTSSYFIIFVLTELCINSKVQNKLRQEIMNKVGTHGNISYDALKEMQYLDMVVSEGLRLHPVVPVLDRICTKPYKIPNSNVTIEKNTPIVVSVYGIHHDSDHFPNPEKFDPERFSPTNKLNIIPGSYMPFGDGPRNCIGLRFALLTIKVAIVKIIQHFEIVLDKPVELPIKYDPRHYFLVPKDKSLKIKFKPLNTP